MKSFIKEDIEYQREKNSDKKKLEFRFFALLFMHKKTEL